MHHAGQSRLQGANGAIDMTPLVEVAIATAVLTTVPPATEVRTAGLSFTPFRPATIESETLIVRARTVTSGATFTFAEALVEDGLGREILRASGVAFVGPMEEVPPPAAMSAVPVEEPRYQSPDPYRRPIPPGVAVFAPETFEQLAGRDMAAGMMTGELPTPSWWELFGLRGVLLADVANDSRRLDGAGRRVGRRALG